MWREALLRLLGTCVGLLWKEQRRERTREGSWMEQALDTGGKPQRPVCGKMPDTVISVFVCDRGKLP